MFLQMFPQNFDDIKGQPEARKIIETYLLRKPLLLYGPTGTGKTASAIALANQHDLELIESNASELRNKEYVQNIIAHAVNQKSLFAKRKLLLIDDVDSFGRSDYGGLPALRTLLKSSHIPIILTASDPWKKQLRGIRQLCILVPYRQIPSEVIIHHLEQRCGAAHISYTIEDLHQIAVDATGDMRAALNDLDASLQHGKIQPYTSMRNQVQTIQQVVTRLLSGNRLKKTETTDATIDDMSLWIEENLEQAFHGCELAFAWEKLALADLYAARIRKRQYWRLLAYRAFLLQEGIAMAKNTGNRTTSIRPNQRILQLWISAGRLTQKRERAEEIARKTHCSIAKALAEYPYMKQFLF